MTEPQSPPPISTPPPALRLADLVRELPGASVRWPQAVTVLTGVRHDSRAVGAGDLFVAREGGKVSGLGFVDAAVARGASAVLTRRGALSESPGVPVIEVDDVPLGLALASSAVYGHPTFGLDVVGITGTNGKTTTSELVYELLNRAGSPTGKIGTLGWAFGGEGGKTTHTSPEADELARIARRMVTRGATHLTMEVSSIALSYKRVDGVRFRVAALTNLSQDHLDFHGDMDSYAAAKARLFFELDPSVSVLNLGDGFGRTLAKDARLGRAVTYAASGDSGADVVPRRVGATSRGIELEVDSPWGRFAIESRLLGAHNVENLLCAATIGLCLELAPEDVGALLSREVSVPGRLERCDDPALDEIAVLVDYAHTPDALERALASVRASASGRVLCVFGCGGDRDPHKRPLMGRAAARGADFVVVTNDNPRSEDPESIARAIVAGMEGAEDRLVVLLDREKAIQHCVLAAHPGDVVLVAGKGHETYQVVGEETLEFDDRVVARRALTVRRGGGSA